MPRNIKGTEPVADPLKAARAQPDTAGEAEVLPEPDPERKPRARVRREQPAKLVRKCLSGHVVDEQDRFCPQCGVDLSEAVTPRCGNGHEVQPEHRYCSQCGLPVQAGYSTVAGMLEDRPRPELELTDAEKAERLRQHEAAVRLGRENPEPVYAPGTAPAGRRTILVHFLVDGFYALGTVWYRGQEAEVWEGHPRWREMQRLAAEDQAAQFRLYGRQVFGTGPWPGERSYTAGAGKFQALKAVGGEGPVAQPTEEELARADEAERRRGRRVPMPIGY